MPQSAELRYVTAIPFPVTQTSVDPFSVTRVPIQPLSTHNSPIDSGTRKQGGSSFSSWYLMMHSQAIRTFSGIASPAPDRPDNELAIYPLLCNHTRQLSNDATPFNHATVLVHDHAKAFTLKRCQWWTGQHGRVSRSTHQHSSFSRAVLIQSQPNCIDRFWRQGANNFPGIKACITEHG